MALISSWPPGIPFELGDDEMTLACHLVAQTIACNPPKSRGAPPKQKNNSKFVTQDSRWFSFEKDGLHMNCLIHIYIYIILCLRTLISTLILNQTSENLRQIRVFPDVKHSFSKKHLRQQNWAFLAILAYRIRHRLREDVELEARFLHEVAILTGKGALYIQTPP